MSVMLRVTYAGTDGNMPESVEVEWADETPDSDLVQALAGLLVTAPGKRRDEIFRKVAEPDTEPRKPASGYHSGETIYSGDRVQLRGNVVYRMMPNTVGECHGRLLGPSVGALVPLEYKVALHPEDREWRAIPSPAGAYQIRAGTDIMAGDRISFAADGFTLYPAKADAAAFPAGVAIDSVAFGTPMVQDEYARDGLTAWRKKVEE